MSTRPIGLPRTGCRGGRVVHLSLPSLTGKEGRRQCRTRSDRIGTSGPRTRKEGVGVQETGEVTSGPELEAGVRWETSAESRGTGTGSQTGIRTHS